MRNGIRPGPLLIAGAAALWATDTFFRTRALQTLSATEVVFWEHVFAGIALLGAFLPRLRRKLSARLSARQWTLLIFIGAGASALATVLFTESFRLINPSITILLQKTQPIMALLLARAVLGERPGLPFYLWAAVAWVGAFLIAFPHGLAYDTFGDFGLHERGVLYALVAAFLWALATVFGRQVIANLAPSTVAFWRYAFGALALIAVLALNGQSTTALRALSSEQLTSLLYMSLIPGLLAMALYYRGLQATPASVATLMELTFPLTAALINHFLLGFRLEPAQWVGSLILIFAALKVGRLPRHA